MALKPPPKAPTENTLLDITAVAIIFILVAGVFGAFFTDAFGSFAAWYTSLLGNIYADREGTFSILKTLLIVLDILLFAFVCYSLYRYTALVGSPKKSADATPELTIVSPRAEVREGWDRIRELANSATPSDWNMAVLRADALVDDILTHLGYEGTSFAERLAIVDPTTMPSIERLWSSHRLRNAIAHDPLVQHDRETIIHALRGYEGALKDLGVLEATPASPEGSAGQPAAS